MYVRFRQYRHDCHVKLVRDQEMAGPGRGDRGDVQEFSYQSRKRLAFVAKNTDVRWHSMLTLTYQADVAPNDGQTVKRHLNALLTRLRREMPGINYLWFFEFTKRGKPHIHILLSEKPDEEPRHIRGGRVIYIMYSRKASGWWAKIAGKTGNSTESMKKVCASWEPGMSQDGLSHYATKYAYKMEQKRIPEGFENVGRLWGHSRPVKPVLLNKGIIEVDSEEEAMAQFSHWEDQHGNKVLHSIQFDKDIGYRYPKLRTDTCMRIEFMEKVKARH